MKTKAAVLYKINQPLIIEDLDVPPLQKGQVLVQMKASGICRSQLNEIKGFKGEDKYLPHLLGHEGSGIVRNIGKGITKVKAGDHVVLTWIKSSGMEANGAQYNSEKNNINSGSISTFSQYAVVSENRLVKVSRKVPFKIAALLGCAVPTGAGIVLHTLKPKPQDTIIIFGIGGVGASAILGARLAKCKAIIAVDINAKALKFAKSLGATHTFLFSEKLEEQLNKIIPERIDFAVEASGKREAMEEAFSIIKDTGTAVIAGNLAKQEKISIDPFGLICGKKILGTWGGETKPDKDIPYYAKQYLAKKLPLEKMISQSFPLSQINKAFDLLKTNQNTGRMIIEF